MPMALMGEQVRPMGTLKSTGIPMLLEISAHCGEVESWRELQQNCFSVVHWLGLYQRDRLSVNAVNSGGTTYAEGAARAPATKAATTKIVLENIFEVRIREKRR